MADPGSIDLPAFARLGDDKYPVDILVLTRPTGGWHVAAVYYREDQGPVTLHPLWTDAWSSDVNNDWAYLSNRVLEGQGGNWYSYEIEGYEVNTAADISPLVTAREANIVASTNGPLGETAGIVTGLDGDAPEVLPFVVLFDDRGYDALLDTALSTSTDCQVRRENGSIVEPVAFISNQHWQRAGARSWQIPRGNLIEIQWGGTEQSTAYLRLDSVGNINYFSTQPPTHVDSATSDPAATVAAPPTTRAPAVNVRRTGYTNAASLPDLKTYEATMLGGQYEWNFATPWVFQVLAAPWAGLPLPDVPNARTPDELERGYWTSLLQMLIYSLGWIRPDLGLWSWYKAGKPTGGDLRLRLLSEVWAADGHLDWLCAWTSSISHHGVGGHNLMAELCGYVPTEKTVDAQWARDMQRSASVTLIDEHSGWGGDGLHLGGHTLGPLYEKGASDRGLLLRSSPHRRQATFVLGSMTGWYANLVKAGRTLPEIGDRSWHVDVVVKPVGWLGTYRRSRTTGLWYSGPHRYHSWGT